MQTDDCTVTHWIYLCTKKPDADQSAKQNWSVVKLKIYDEEGLGSDFEEDSESEQDKVKDQK